MRQVDVRSIFKSLLITSDRNGSDWIGINVNLIICSTVIAHGTIADSHKGISSAAHGRIQLKLFFTHKNVPPKRG